MFRASVWKLNLACLALYGSSQAVGSRRLKQLPRPSLVERDDRSHVVLAHRAVDERGDVDAPQPLHTVQVCKRLIGKIPAQQIQTWWQGQRSHPEVILFNVKVIIYFYNTTIQIIYNI